MSVKIYITGNMDNIEQFVQRVIYKESGRLYDNGLFRISKNDGRYMVASKKKNTVKRLIRGYCPIPYPYHRTEESMKIYEKYDIDKALKEDKKKIGVDIEQIKCPEDVELKLGLAGDWADINIFYEEFLLPNIEIYAIEKDTGLYTSPRGWGARHIGGHLA